MFQWAVGLASTAALYLLAVSRTSRRTALLAATTYYTSPHIFHLSASAKSDLAWQMALFLSFHTLLVWHERGEPRWFWLSAIATGVTLAMRHHGLFWAPSIGITMLILQWAGWKRAPFRTGLRAVLYGVLSALIVSPWWLRNWLATGDPIWPYGYPIFHSRFWSQALHDKYVAWTQGPGDSLWHYATGLWNLSLNQSAWLFGLRVPITPVLLAFIPGLLLVWPCIPNRTRRFLGLILVPVSVYYTLWFTTYQQTRYLFPMLALLMIPAAYSFWQMTRFRWSRWVFPAHRRWQS